MKLHIYLIGLLSGLLFNACTDKIDLTLEDPEPVLVVDGFISNIDTTQYIQLSSLENYFANTPPNYAIHKGATVALLEDSIQIKNYTFNPTTERFEMQYQGLIGHAYQIDITLEDGTRYVSEAESMREIVPIDTIWYEIVDIPSNPTFEEGDINVLINTREPAGVGDFYQWKAHVNNQYQHQPENLFVADDRFVDGQDIYDFEVFQLSPEEFDAHLAKSPTDQVFVKIEQVSISSRYFQFVSLVTQQLLQVGSPFDAPPSQIRGNVYEQGKEEILALGYFYTAAIDAKTVEIVL